MNEDSDLVCCIGFDEWRCEHGEIGGEPKKDFLLRGLSFALYRKGFAPTPLCSRTMAPCQRASMSTRHALSPDLVGPRLELRLVKHKLKCVGTTFCSRKPSPGLRRLDFGAPRVSLRSQRPSPVVPGGSFSSPEDHFQTNLGCRLVLAQGLRLGTCTTMLKANRKYLLLGNKLIK